MDAGWLIGFIEGEGCFAVTRHSKTQGKFKYAFKPVFTIGLHEKHYNLLTKISNFLNCGKIYFNKKTHSVYIRIENIHNCLKVLAFFDKNRHYFLTDKGDVYDRWKEIVLKLRLGEHRNTKGLNEIGKLREKLNPQFKKIRTYKHCDNWESIQSENVMIIKSPLSTQQKLQI